MRVQRLDRLTLRSAVLGMMLAGCSSEVEGGSAADGAAGGGGASGDDGSSSTGAAGGDGIGSTTSAGGSDSDACPLPEPQDSPTSFRTLEVVEGSVRTVDGDPAADVEVQLCGKNLCLYGGTSEDGSYAVANPGAEPLDTPIIKAGDGLLETKFGFAIPADGQTVDAIVAPMVDSGTPLAPGATAEADGVTLEVAGDGTVVLNVLDFGDPGEDTFRAAVMPDTVVELVAPGEGFAAVLHLGPRDTRFCPPAKVSIPNTGDLDPGAAVELHLYGLDVGEAFGPYGVWSKVASGRVSEDGGTITTDEGEGIPVLGPIAVLPVD